MQLRDDHLIDDRVRLNRAQANLDGGFDISHFAGEKRQPFAVQTIGQADFQQGDLRAFDARIRRSDGRRNGGGFDYAERSECRTRSDIAPSGDGIDYGWVDMRQIMAAYSLTRRQVINRMEALVSSGQADTALMYDPDVRRDVRVWRLIDTGPRP